MAYPCSLQPGLLLSRIYERTLNRIPREARVEHVSLTTHKDHLLDELTCTTTYPANHNRFWCGLWGYVSRSESELALHLDLIHAARHASKKCLLLRFTTPPALLYSRDIAGGDQAYARVEHAFNRPELRNYSRQTLGYVDLILCCPSCAA